MIITCNQLIKRVTDAREHKLSALDRVGFALHLVRCRYCRRYVAQMDLIVDALHSAAPAEPATPELHDALAKALAARRTGVSD